MASRIFTNKSCMNDRFTVEYDSYSYANGSKTNSIG